MAKHQEITKGKTKANKLKAVWLHLINTAQEKKKKVFFTNIFYLFRNQLSAFPSYNENPLNLQLIAAAH